MASFNPNAVGQPNGNYFALPSYKPEEAQIVLISVPWDVTTSYRTGTSQGPESMIEASAQIDLYDADIPNAWEMKIATLPIDKALGKLNKKARKTAEEIIAALELGTTEDELAEFIAEVNAASMDMNQYVYNKSKFFADKNKLVAVVGGEHSVPFGLLKALEKKHETFGILHIDAHADLREAYEGFEYSHASIMYNALHKLGGITKLVQVGIRDYCEEEATLIQRDSRIAAYSDASLHEALFNGKTWAQQCQEIISQLPDKVHISFDIDGLLPDNCPNTGTPVPGGLSFNQATFLLHTLVLSGKQIIGFDLCEVSPSIDTDNDWDANVGARLLYKLCGCLQVGNIQKK